jgi:ADP-heptose:LPS heptosyltransferase
LNIRSGKDWKRTFMSEKTAFNERHPERGNRLLKFIDRYAGIPIVAALGLVKGRRKAATDNNIGTAAFLQTAAIGDTILSSAIVQDLKKAFPRVHITLFTGASNYDIACMLPGIDKVVKLPIANPLEAIRLIRSSGAFDVWIDLGPWPRLNALYSFFALSSLSVGFRTPHQYRHALYDIAVPHSSQRHELDNYRALLQAVGISSTNSFPSVTVDAMTLMPNNVVMHLFPGGSRFFLKEWTDSRWIEVIDQLTGKGMTVSLTGTPGNRERALALKARVRDGDKVDVVAGSCSLRDVARLLAASRLTISVDTGIMHLASALHCNLISLHGPTSPKRWGPLNDNAIALSSTMPCVPCLSLGFESNCSRAACMEDITVDQVLSAVGKFLPS